MRLEQLAISLVFWLVLKLPWSHSHSQCGTFTGSGSCQNCFFPNLSRTLRLLVVEFELIMVITHE